MKKLKEIGIRDVMIVLVIAGWFVGLIYALTLAVGTH